MKNLRMPQGWCKINFNQMMKYQIDNSGDSLRVLTGAEAFGYGPCSKLVCVVKKMKDEFPKSRVDFFGEGSALNFAKKNKALFFRVKRYCGKYPNPNNYNLVISAMNPYLILWGWFNHKKCVYLDSLYWFWTFEKKEFKKIEQVIGRLTDAESIDEVWALIKDINEFHLHYISYRLSSASCSQHFNDSKRDIDIFRKNIKNMVEVNPIIDTTHKKRVERDTILISLGGLLSPVNHKKEAIAYVNLILKISKKFISEVSEKYKIMIVTNSEITSYIKKVSRGITVASLTQDEMLKTINRSALVLTSAGITTMYECLIYETPFFTLPELHYGHHLNYIRLAGNDTKKLKKLQLIFPNSLINPRIDRKQQFDPYTETRKIQSIIRKLILAEDSISQEMQRNLNKLLPIISDSKRLRKMANDQKDFVFGKNTNKYKEILEVIKEVIRNNQLPAVRKKHLAVKTLDSQYYR